MRYWALKLTGSRAFVGSDGTATTIPKLFETMDEALTAFGNIIPYIAETYSRSLDIVSVDLLLSFDPQVDNCDTLDIFAEV